jgi:hypothetical protein
VNNICLIGFLVRKGIVIQSIACFWCLNNRYANIIMDLALHKSKERHQEYKMLPLVGREVIHQKLRNGIFQKYFNSNSFIRI